MPAYWSKKRRYGIIVGNNGLRPKGAQPRANSEVVGMNTYRFEKHCWAEIDLDALRENFAYVRQQVGGPVCAVIKADAYGHGDVAVARALHHAGAAGFAVSCLSEAKRLRRHGVTAPIMILGYTASGFASELAHLGVTQALFSAEYAQALSDAASKAGVSVSCHLKVDTGMGRIGFAVRDDFDTALAQMLHCYDLSGLSITGVFQHFAAADSDAPDDIAYTQSQYELFCRTLDALRAAGHPTGVTHCANSAAQLRHPEWRADMSRAGIVLYGLDPSAQAVFPALRPVMTLKTVISQVKTLGAGQSVCYGRTYTAETPRRVATVSVGYADGYPRRLSGSEGGGVMMVHGRPAPVLGRVCMDQTVIDVTDIPEAAMGDEVVVFGPESAAAGADTADDVARKAGTISYEVVCGISRRVPRVYWQNGSLVSIWNNLEES